MMNNRPGGVLYIGSTADLPRRVEQHQTNSGSAFTRKYQCHRLVWFEQFDDLQDAQIVERRMKAWKRAWKIEKIESANPEWNDLSNLLN